MRTIPFDEALSLLDKAYGIHIPDADHLPEADFHLSLDEDIFLRLEAENEEGLVWSYRFDREHNQTVKIDGDRMTLVFDATVVDDVEPEVEIRIMVPMQLDPPADQVPEEVLVALSHVRSVFPDVDRVVFWEDGRWAYMTDAHQVPPFDDRISTSILEDAGDAVANFSPCRIFAYQLPE